MSDSDSRIQSPTPGAGPGTVPLGVGEPFAPPPPPSGRDVSVPPGTAPTFRDYPRLVFSAPYFTQNPLAEMFAPAVYEAGLQVIPGILQASPLLQNAVNAAVQQLAVLKHGDTMTGPLFFVDPLPTQDNQAASKLYVDMMLASGGAGGGIGEVPVFPTNEIWARVLGAWLPISTLLGGGGGGGDGLSLPLTGGTMLGPINMNGSSIDNLGPVPAMPNGAAPASWVLEEIAASSLYQGTWIAQANNPNLALPAYQQNAFMWIAITPDFTQPFTVQAPVPGLQGQSIFNGDHVIWSTAEGRFDIIKGSSISLTEAQTMFLSLSGGNMQGPMTLSADGTTNLAPVTLQQLNGRLATQNQPTLNQPRIMGVTDNSNAQAGAVGEFLIATNGTGTALTLQTLSGSQATTLTWTVAVQLSLAAGDWDVTANAAFAQPSGPGAPAGSIVSVECQALLHTATTVDAARAATWPKAWAFTAMDYDADKWWGNPNFSLGTMRFSSAIPFTVYVLAAIVSALPGYTPNSLCYGSMAARRVR